VYLSIAGALKICSKKMNSVDFSFSSDIKKGKYWFKIGRKSNIITPQREKTRSNKDMDI
jgi:hypothetical protein